MPTLSASSSAFLASLEGAPRIDSLPPADARAMLTAMGAVPRAFAAPEDVSDVRDRVVPVDPGSVPVRVYTPKGSAPYPCLVWFHGGGWVIGDLESHDDACRALANRAGAVVVAVDYRMAPEHVFPTAVEDCYAVTRWVADHAAELGIDPARLAVGGDSAGGNLAAVVSILARDGGGPELAFQLLVYPATDAAMDTESHRRNAEGYFLDRPLMEWFYGHYATVADRADWRASPLRAPDLSGLPPALVITAEFDPLLDEGEAYAERLRAAGVPATVRRFDGLIHGFFGMPVAFPEALQAFDEAGAALREAFGSTAVPDAGVRAPSERIVELQGGRFKTKVLVKGDGPPLVFLHGAAGLFWARLLDELARTHTVYAPEQPGAGESQGLEHLDTVWDLALYYDDLLTELGIERATLVGHSFGGMVAAEIASIFPNRVDRLVLLAPLGLWRDELPVTDIYGIPPERLAAALYAHPEGMLAATLAPPVGDPDAMLRLVMALAAAAQFLWPIPDKGLSKRLHRVAAPTLLVWGRQDGVVPAAYAEDFARAIGGARVELIDDAAHMAYLEQPEVVSGAVTRFLSG